MVDGPTASPTHVTLQSTKERLERSMPSNSPIYWEAFLPYTGKHWHFGVSLAQFFKDVLIYMSDNRSLYCWGYLYCHWMRVIL